MKRGSKVLLVVLVFTLLAASVSMAQETKNATPAYLFSILLGFGTGHFYLHDDAAKKFLLLDAGSLAAVIGGEVVVLVSVGSWVSGGGTDMPTGVLVGYGVMVVGALAYTGFRVWEVVDIFKTVGEMRTAGKITMRPDLQFTPEGGTHIGVALSY